MKQPQLHPSVRLAPGAVVTGEVVMEADCSVWYHAVLRAEEAVLRVGARTNIQECCVLHVDKDFPIVLGEGVTVGHGAILHGCTVGDNTLVGMGAIVLNGAKIGRNCLIAAGALVPQGMEIPDGMLAIGSPAKVKRPLTEEELEGNRHAAEEYLRYMRDQLCITSVTEISE